MSINRWMDMGEFPVGLVVRIPTNILCNEISVRQEEEYCMYIISRWKIVVFPKQDIRSLLLNKHSVLYERVWFHIWGLTIDTFKSHYKLFLFCSCGQGRLIIKLSTPSLGSSCRFTQRASTITSARSCIQSNTSPSAFSALSSHF